MRVDESNKSSGSHCQEVLYLQEQAGLAQILGDAAALCIWQRKPEPALAQLLARAADSEPFSLDEVGDAQSLDFATLLQGFAWSSDPALRLWVEDLRRLAMAYSAVTGSSAVRCRLAVVSRVDCPVFHTDWIGLRMLCTYHGSGTEFVHSHNVDRSALCQPLDTPALTNAAIVSNRLAIEQMQAFEVGLFKGNAWPGHKGRGIVHRSPTLRPHELARIKLTIDQADG